MQTKNLYARATAWAFPVLIIFLLYSLFTCHAEKQSAADLREALKTNEAQTTQLKNNQGKDVAQNQTIITTDPEGLKKLTAVVFDLQAKNARLITAVSSYAKVLQQIKLQGKEAVYLPAKNDSGRIVYVEQPKDTNLIRVPRSFAYQDSTITFAGTVKRNAVSLDSLDIPNTLNIRTATEKTGFLNLGRRQIVQAVNSNPAIKNTGVSSIVLQQRPNAWQRWLKPILFFVGGAYAGSKIK